ncbi:MAG: hypothetical protein ACLVAT_03430 [Lachnospiraceae bacterium]
MKKLKMTKREAAIDCFLELCHGLPGFICHLCLCGGNFRPRK